MDLILFLTKWCYVCGLLFHSISGQEITRSPSHNSEVTQRPVIKDESEVLINFTSEGPLPVEYNDGEQCSRVFDIEWLWDLDFGDGQECLSHVYSNHNSTLQAELDTISPACARCRCLDECPSAGEDTDLGEFDFEDEPVYDDGVRCSRAWQLEVEWGLDFGQGSDCMSYFWSNPNSTITTMLSTISQDCVMCRCINACPWDDKDSKYDDFAAEIDNVVWNEHTISSLVVYSTVMAVGTIGNLLVIITVLVIFIKPINVTNMYITSLAVADFLVCAMVIPFQIYLLLRQQIFDLSAIWCKMLYYLYYTFFVASVLSLTAMSLERFFVICYPMKAQYVSTPKRAKMIIGVVWPLAFALASPVAVQANKFGGQCRLHRLLADDDWSGPLFIYISVAIFVVPATIMGYAYLRTSLALWKSIKMAKGMTNEKESQEKKKESKDVRSRLAVIRMLISVWVVFIACWAPFLAIMLIITNDEPWLNDRLSTYQYSHLVPNLVLVTMANSALNPALYAFMSKRFRRGFMKCFLCCLESVRTKTTSSTDSTSALSRTRETTVSTVAATLATANKN